MDRRDFTRPGLEFSVHHTSEAWQGEVTLGSGSADEVDLSRRETSTFDSASRCIGSHLGVREERPLMAVDRVVTKPDAVLFKDALPYARYLAVDEAKVRLHFVVANRLARKKLTQRGDVGVHELYSRIDLQHSPPCEG